MEAGGGTEEGDIGEGGRAEKGVRRGGGRGRERERERERERQTERQRDRERQLMSTRA